MKNLQRTKVKKTKETNEREIKERESTNEKK